MTRLAPTVHRPPVGLCLLLSSVHPLKRRIRLHLERIRYRVLDLQTPPQVSALSSVATPDVAVVCLTADNALRGPAWVDAIVRKFPAAPIVVVAAKVDEVHLREACMAGAVSSVDVGGGFAELTTVLRELHYDALLERAEELDQYVADTLEATADPVTDNALIVARDMWRLQDRQARILAHLLVGLSRSEIATALRLSQEQLERELREMMRGSGSASCAEMVHRFETIRAGVVLGWTRAGIC